MYRILLKANPPQNQIKFVKRTSVTMHSNRGPEVLSGQQSFT
jgi:hypothetical protein